MLKHQLEPTLAQDYSLSRIQDRAGGLLLALDGYRDERGLGRTLEHRSDCTPPLASRGAVWQSDTLSRDAKTSIVS